MIQGCFQIVWVGFTEVNFPVFCQITKMIFFFIFYASSFNYPLMDLKSDQTSFTLNSELKEQNKLRPSFFTELGRERDSGLLSGCEICVSVCVPPSSPDCLWALSGVASESSEWGNNLLEVPVKIRVLVKWSGINPIVFKCFFYHVLL